VKSLAALLLFSIPAFCQYPEIVTTDDGQQVYFTTLLVERSAPAAAPTELRIFQVDGRALRVFVERGSLARTDAGGTGDGASSVQVTGDGQSVAFILTNICPPGDPCRTTIRRAEIRGRGATVLGEANRVLLSRNGKWALLVPPLFSFPGPAGEPPQQNTEATLVNLETGEKSAVGMPLTFDGAFVLASDGSVLQRVQTKTGAEIGVRTNGTLKPLPPVTGAAAFLGMSDDAGTVLVSRLDLPALGQPLTTLPAPDLIALDLRAGTSKVLQSLEHPGRYILLGISNDGHRALLRTEDQNGPGAAMLVDVETGKSTTLTIGEDERALSGTLSGFGNVAIVATNSGRILRLALDSSGNITSTEELLPATPYFNPNALLAPGALIDADRPMPGSIDWSGRIQLNNVPLAVIRETGVRMTLQVPWELQVGMAAVFIDYPSESPLTQRSRLFVATQAPRFVTPAPGASRILGGMLIKGDFSGYVTTPPQPGDIVNMYMTGLGAVRGAVKTGEPAPTGDLRPIDGYMHCTFTPHTTDAETLFAGLAPGMVGIYQVTFRFPADTPADVPPTGMRCGFNTPGYNFIMQSVGMP